MLVVVLVCLTDGVESFMEVGAIVVLAGRVHIFEDDEDAFIGIKGWSVGGDFVHLKAELFHVLLEGQTPIGPEVEGIGLKSDHFFFSGTFCGGGNSGKQIGLTIFVDPFWDAISVFEYVIRDSGPNDGRDSLGGTLVPMISWMA